ncbi:nucleoside triphosphate pyrophosphohydrolase [Sphaerisporangium melleum]|uniref:Nucleoside triphosphate pyrophosphohydrolase n=1 Tax=Sphaerisporangium melleum TaxID=321316 RepID=A0A917QV68_9ACTN|nr:MazG family protein [Sphaerisporangium melleum]GGK69271.1 nucleoside triphosphate pyrophosphohydrolase [Sphaerisporangium melleum]GII68996.1 nucleoside triphosphate pyrophosphohydrolase [Sphaerisporangium melleum]
MPLLVVTTSPRVAPGLLSGRAWAALGSGRVLTGSGDHPLLPYLAEEGIPAEVVTPDPAALAREGRDGTVVWLAAQDGDEALMRAVGHAALDMDDPPVIELVPGSYDLPGARLLDLVAVMDRLRRNCPWDAQQTHESLVPYLLEEAYEVLETIEEGDHTALREELGDLLLQVVFHARLAQERAPADGGFDVDDVAGGIVDKLVRRHPHVFAGRAVSGADEVSDNWDAIKAAERAAKGRESLLDGVPMGQPALALAAGLRGRAERAGAPESLARAVGQGIGRELFDLVGRARAAGLDPEAELRAAARAYRDRVHSWERAERPAGSS